MKIKNAVMIFFVFLVSILNSESDFEKYKKLKIKNVDSITFEDLPKEFGIEAFKTVRNFIGKTSQLKTEWLVYFDYKTGEILKCIEGGKDNVKLKIEDDEFEGHYVASIHNHPSGVFSPPSNRNFNILLREYEDYELIASNNELWILRAKCVDNQLANEFNRFSLYFFYDAVFQADSIYSNDKFKDQYVNLKYGDSLLKYINDKKLKDIQLTKKRYKNAR